MLVKDRTETDYKGRWTEACEVICPCRPCFNAHDCGDYGYNAAGHHVWVTRMECATRWNNGCPTPKPAPEHIIVKARGRICVRCKVGLSGPALKAARLRGARGG